MAFADRGGIEGRRARRDRSSPGTRAAVRARAAARARCRPPRRGCERCHRVRAKRPYESGSVAACPARRLRPRRARQLGANDPVELPALELVGIAGESHDRRAGAASRSRAAASPGGHGARRLLANRRIPSRLRRPRAGPSPGRGGAIRSSSTRSASLSAGPMTASRSLMARSLVVVSKPIVKAGEQSLLSPAASLPGRSRTPRVRVRGGSRGSRCSRSRRLAARTGTRLR